MDSPAEFPKKEESASFLSRITYSWLTGLIRLGHKRPLLPEDLYGLRTVDEADTCAAVFQEAWDEQLRRKARGEPYSLFRAIRAAFARDFVRAGVFKIVNDVLLFTPPVMVELIVRSVEDEGSKDDTSYLPVVGLLVLPLLASFSLQYYFYSVQASGMRVRAAVTTAVFAKATRLTGSARGDTGSIVNLMSLDAEKLNQTARFLHFSWSGVVQILIAVILLNRLVSWTAFIALALLILLIPLQGWLGKMIGRMRGRILAHSDERIRLTNELFQGIRVIKMYAWEEAFRESIFGARTRETKELLRSAVVKAFNFTVLVVGPALVAAITLSIYGATHDDLRASKIFPALQLINILRGPLIVFPMVVNGIFESKLSLKRIQDFLLADELEKREPGQNREMPIVCKKASFTWELVEGGQAAKDEAENAASAKDQKAVAPAPAAEEQKRKKKKKKNKMRRVDASSSSSSYEDDGGAAKKKKKKNKMRRVDASDSVSSLESESEGARARREAVGAFKLHDIDLEIERGSLVMIVGSVASGKSSLAAALLGEMRQTGGQCFVTGTVAYAAQQPWIMNATVKENVSFGNAFDRARFDLCVDVCQLKHDLKILPAGEDTAIGEKGINLSGGQKHRISLARAVYANFDTIIMDDPLAAVDAYVGQHIFSKCIAGELKDKTRILITHQLQYASRCDRIIVMEEGRVAEIGSFSELMAKDGSFAQMMNEHGGVDEESKDDSDASSSADGSGASHESTADAVTSAAASTEASTTAAAREAGVAEDAGEKIMTVEERSTGTISWRVYLQYFAAMSDNFVMPLLIFLLFAIVQAFSIATDLWVASWSREATEAEQDPTADEVDNGYYAGVYLAFAFCFALFTLARTLLLTVGGLRSSSTLHGRMFDGTVYSPLSFFDTTPVGRILNRFSRDMDVADNLLGFSLSQFLTILFMLASAFVMIAIISSAYTLIIVVPVVIIYYLLQNWYRVSSREMKRLDSIHRSPLFSHFSETLGGLSTIRAYNAPDQFIRVNRERVDESNRAYWVTIAGQRWLNLRLNALGAVFGFNVALIVVIYRDSLDPALAGLTLSYAMRITNFFTLLLMFLTETENHLNSVERMVEYGALESEGARVVPDARPDDAWPRAGAIDVKKLDVRYREGLPLVLKDVTASIAPGEKVGIVGRTGSGKSSLMLSLLRFIRAESGTIVIDGVDTSAIGLRDLRSRLSVVPQDPVLFSGSLRYNIDPFNEHSDERLWKALDTAGLKGSFERNNVALDHQMAEGGDNLSVGERQLVCLTRAMLRDSRILIMDEATASVDQQTDAAVQQMIRERFTDVTLLVVAHRLLTVIDFDKILVLDDGRVAEFDSPKNLLKQPNGILYGLVQETGPAMAEHLTAVANGKEDAVDLILDGAASPPLAAADAQGAHPALAAVGAAVAGAATATATTVLAKVSKKVSTGDDLTDVVLTVDAPASSTPPPAVVASATSSSSDDEEDGSVSSEAESTADDESDESEEETAETSTSSE